MQSLQDLKKYKSIIKKKRKKHDKTVLLETAKLDTIKVLISQALINSYFRHDKFVSVNNVLILKMLWNILYKNDANLFC